jgi:cell division protease FtsH
MEWYWTALLAVLTSLLGVGGGLVLARLWQKRKERQAGKRVRSLLEQHFRPISLEDLVISERQFPYRVRADLQRAIDRLFMAGTTVRHFCGIRKEYSYFEGLGFAGLLVEGHQPAISVPPEYEDVDVGDEQPIRCMKNGLWLLEEAGTRFAVLLSPVGRHLSDVTGMQFQIATPNQEAGTHIGQGFFKHLEEAITRAASYRGKVLSLEQEEHSYSGASAGITVHRLRTVCREEVILPARTLQLLERNVIHFTRQRPKLASVGLSTRKGILFYGPPGTGKTHTIHYLAGALPGHTTLLISAEQVALLSEYMTLARVLQPSVVVMEDVDLIARERSELNNACAEPLLNKLLNEMDGLKEEADILFILTTNRPESLEAALASRPGRIDQAIEFPLPDAPAREKLVRLYARGIELSPEVVHKVVQRTDGVSAAFIKELMRRSVQFHLERAESPCIEEEDVEGALEEMVFQGGSLNPKLLGVGQAFGFAAAR